MNGPLCRAIGGASMNEAHTWAGHLSGFALGFTERADEARGILATRGATCCSYSALACGSTLAGCQ